MNKKNVIKILSLLFIILVTAGCKTDTESPSSFQGGSVATLQVSNGFSTSVWSDPSATQTELSAGNFVTQTALVTPINPPQTTSTPPVSTILATNPAQPTAENPFLQSETPIPTSSYTQIPDLTSTATAVPTQNPSDPWSGSWIFFIEVAEGQYERVEGSLSWEGPVLQGQFLAQESPFSLQGDNEQNPDYLNGIYSWGMINGWFSWRLTGGNQQFQGTLDNQKAFCGARQGFNQPDPCGFFVPY